MQCEPQYLEFLSQIVRMVLFIAFHVYVYLLYFLTTVLAFLKVQVPEGMDDVLKLIESQVKGNDILLYMKGR